MTNLLLHIGQTKTGTTSIQSLFHENQDFLLKNGINYMARPRTAKSHRYLYHLLYLECYSSEIQVLNKHIARLVEIGLIDRQLSNPQEICERGWSLLTHSILHSEQGINVISEELFWHLGSFKKKERIKLLEILKNRLCQFVDLKNISIAVSLRFPIDWVESWHNQLVKDAGNTTLIKKFVQNLSNSDAFDYAQILNDWTDVFQDSEVILKDFHAELTSKNEIFPLNFLDHYGLNTYMSRQDIAQLSLPPQLQESIHPFLHHWLTINKPSVSTSKQRNQLIKKASRQVRRFAESKFPGIKFTLLNEELKTQISEQFSVADSGLHAFGWSSKSSRVKHKQRIPRPIPRRGRMIMENIFYDK